MLDMKRIDFSSITEWYIYNLMINYAPLDLSEPKLLVDRPINKAELDQSKIQLHTFFYEIYEDMYQHPDKYGLPVAVKKDANVRKMIKRVKGIFTVMYSMAGKAELIVNDIYLSPWEYDEIISSQKDADIESIIFGVMGFNRERSKTQIRISHEKYSQMLLSLMLLAEFADKNKKDGLRKFMACDFSCMSKRSYSIEDVSRVLEPGLGSRIIALDQKLKSIGLKRSIQTYEDVGFRIYYKYGTIVLYVVMTRAYQDAIFSHYVRWMLDSSQGQLFFLEMEKSDPVCEEMLYHQLRRCDPFCVPGYGANNPDQCGSRKPVLRKGITEYICMEESWKDIPPTQAGYEYLDKTLCLMTNIMNQ